MTRKRNSNGGWTIWENIGGSCASAPAAHARPGTSPSLLDVLCRGTDGNVHINHRVNGSYVGFGSLGAPPWRTFLRVTLPLSLPAIVLAAGLGFVLSMSAYITPKLLGGGRVFVLATEIFEHANTNANWPMASAMALFTLALMLAFLALANFLSGRLAQ